VAGCACGWTASAEPLIALSAVVALLGACFAAPSYLALPLLLMR